MRLSFLIYAIILNLVVINFAHSSQCEEVTPKSIVYSSKKIVVAEKLYSGMRFSDYSSKIEDISRFGDVVRSWGEYREGIDYVEFLVERPYKGKAKRGDVIRVPNTPVLQKDYGVGNKYLMFLEEEHGEWVVNTCLVVDLTLREVAANFKRMTDDEYKKFIIDVEKYIELEEQGGDPKNMDGYIELAPDQKVLIFGRSIQFEDFLHVLNNWEKVRSAIYMHDKKDCVRDNLTINSLKTFDILFSSQEENKEIFTLGADNPCYADGAPNDLTWKIEKSKSEYKVMDVLMLKE